MLKNRFIIPLLAVAMLGVASPEIKADDKPKDYVFHGAGNPYLPLWEHLPDGEPRVFEDPDKPGHYRMYIIGSHDVRLDSYCGNDIRMWSAPVEDLSSWRDEGPLFTYNIENQWDVMYAPDIVEVRRPGGEKEYYLYPHSRGRNREAMVTKGSRPDGPFTPVNMNAEGTATIPGSIMGFDPSIWVEQITDPTDPDYSIGFRAYGYWGFQRSSAAQLDQNTMYSVRPGTEVIPNFMPAMHRPRPAGAPRPGAGGPGGAAAPKAPEITYPCIYPGEDLNAFNFFEASSIRKVGNKFVVIYSGYSGPDYGLDFSNSTLRYAYGDTPLGPWKNGGVLVDSRGPVVNQDGSKLETTNSGHNTHGSIMEINNQWYVFYHRPPRGFGFARQAMVAPIHVVCDEKPVAEGGKVVIKGFDPYSADQTWAAKDSQGNEYRGAEVTSEGFHVFGLDPYQYYSAGYACYLSDTKLQQDAWDIWDNNAPLAGVAAGNIVGYKYFGFGGLASDQLGLKAFKGTKKGNNTALNLFIVPKTTGAFKISVWLDGPWDNATWKGTKIGEVVVPEGGAAGAGFVGAAGPAGAYGAGAAGGAVVAGAADAEVLCYKVDVSKFVDGLDKKHAIFLVAESHVQGPLFDLIGLGFSSKKVAITRPVPPTVSIFVDGKAVEMPLFPVRSTNANGIMSYDIYEASYAVPAGTAGVPKVTASSNSKDVKISVSQAESATGCAVVKFDYRGVVKTYRVMLGK